MLVLKLFPGEGDKFLFPEKTFGSCHGAVGWSDSSFGFNCIQQLVVPSLGLGCMPPFCPQNAKNMVFIAKQFIAPLKCRCSTLILSIHDNGIFYLCTIYYKATITALFFLNLILCYFSEKVSTEYATVAYHVLTLCESCSLFFCKLSDFALPNKIFWCYFIIALM